jgi:hypothetical protein
MIKKLRKMWGRQRWTVLALLDSDCWRRNYKTSKKLTKFIHESLDAGHVPTQVSGRPSYMMLNGLHLWAENYPYAFAQYSGGGQIASCSPTFIRIPSRGATYRLFHACAWLYQAKGDFSDRCTDTWPWVGNQSENKWKDDSDEE